MAHSFQTSLQYPAAATNQARQLEDEGVEACASFAGPDAEISLAVSVEPFQLCGFHMMWNTYQEWSISCIYPKIAERVGQITFVQAEQLTDIQIDLQSKATQSDVGYGIEALPSQKGWVEIGTVV